MIARGRSASLAWSSASVFESDPGCLDLWWSELGPESEADRALLSEDELERAARQRPMARSVRFGAGRAFLRRVLARYCAAGAGELRFCLGEHGKPRLQPAALPARLAGLEFNLSHSGPFVLLAVAFETPVGVDLELRDSGRGVDQIAERFFAPEEVRELRLLSGEQRLRAFYDVWVCKEAHLKALGTGLSFSPRRFAVHAATGESPRVAWTEREGDDPSRWRIDRVATPDDAAAAAVCWSGGERALRAFRLPGSLREIGPPSGDSQVEPR